MRRVRDRAQGARIASTAGLLALSIGVAACGSGGSDGVATLGSRGTSTTVKSAAKANPEDAMLAFARCMREHGIDMPDPQLSTDGKAGGFVKVGGPGKDGMDQTKMQAANEACKGLLGAVQRGNPLDPAEEAKMRDNAVKFAQCMRDHGVDMPDPTFGDDGRVVVSIGGPGGVKRTSEEFDAAQEACSEIMGGPFGKPGSGGMSVESNGAATKAVAG